MKTLQNILVLGLREIKLSSSLQLFNCLHLYTQGVRKYNEHILNKQLLGLSVFFFHKILFYEMHFLYL